MLVLCLLSLINITACGKPTEEQVRKKMEQHLYEKYGEEFVVGFIGIRKAGNMEFYTTQIYPKLIVGTESEGDSYYYANVNIEMLSMGKLGKPGDNYGDVKIKEKAEEYLLPKAKEIFGERIRIKAEPDFKEKREDRGAFYGYVIPSFKEARKRAKENPDKYRLELTLYLYLFDRIDSEEEKEERREQIFEFIQYLKVEGLFEYLEMYVVFTDEIFLSSSFEKYERTLNNREEERIDIEKKLREELRNITEKDLIRNMNKIRKSDLGIESNERLYRFNQSRFLVLAMEKLKIDRYGRYDRAKATNTVERHNYKEKEDIEFLRYEHYIFK
jgi:hypothetical protein